ncbi:diguanylate cyclase [Pseudomonas alcaligenes]|uniref:diguanylate cyclase domain-containing protein n=1 Tax=Aquipseudomonas alcaligenes TaxID=43263 RepID=UPI002E7B8726|nr:diguanylate cyclase [Pseudomonas alcaligenes]MEE1949282.1 diguanylate cyclase [Pseudomonas alcaligenes]
METWLDERLGRPKLLLVDDQPMNIRVLHQLFRYECDVHMATGGEQAIEVCKALLPDLILLDVVMEGMDGHEVCRRLKADPLTQDIPIIFLSANGEEDDEAIGLELGAVDYIGKPFNPMIVRARVKTHLTLKRQGDYLRSMAMLDGLTGVANRRKLEARLEAAWSQACRDNGPLSLIMIDVDYFKKYNDHYGHQRGDQCLRRLAMALAATLNRPYDLLARYGGEEFACLLPDTDLAGAERVAQKMLAAVAELRIEHLASDVGPQVSLSLGVATVLASARLTPQELLRRADEQLYLAKAGGRARVCARFYAEDAAEISAR